MGSRVTAVGRNPSFTNTRVDLWNVGGTYVFPPAPTQMSVVSTSAQDGVGGTGVRQIVILYLDNNYAQQTTTVTMNGVTPVLTTPTNILRILKVFSTVTGTGGSAAGTITVTNGGHTYAQIDIAYTASRQAIGTVPAGTAGYITDIVLSGSSTAATDFMEFDIRISALDTMILPGIFITVATFGLGTGNAVQQVCTPPIYVPATADVKITMSRTVGSGTCTAAGSFSGWLDTPLIV